MRLSSAVGSIVNVDWLYQLRQNKCFSLGTVVVGVAAVIGHIQLMNPVGSGVTALVWRIYAGYAALVNAKMTQYNTALTTDVGAGVNLSSGQAAGLCHVRSQTNGALLGTTFLSQTAGANIFLELADSWVQLLPAGTGLVVACDTVNVGLGATLFWTEL